MLRLPESDPELVARHVAAVLGGFRQAGVAAQLAEALAADTARHYHGRPVEVRVEWFEERLRITVTARQPALPSGDSTCHLGTVSRLASCYGMGSTEQWADIWAEIDLAEYRAGGGCGAAAAAACPEPSTVPPAARDGASADPADPAAVPRREVGTHPNE